MDTQSPAPQLLDGLDPALLDRYLIGGCTPSERHAVEIWLSEHPARRTILAGMRRGLKSLEHPGLLNTEERQAQLSATIAAHASHAHASANAKPPFNRRHTPIPRLGARLPRRWVWPGAAVIATAFVMFFVQSHAPRATGKTRIYATPVGARATVTLTDGSRVMLASRTTLTVPGDFGALNRTVSLQGEAYFDVSAESQRPFSVRTRESVTRVLGTSFAVKAYAADLATRVVVSTGKVAVVPSYTTPSSGAVTLAAGDLAVVNGRDAVAVTRAVSVNRYLEWTRGHLVYTMTPLSDVIPDLERWYGLKIVLSDPALLQERIKLALDIESADQAIAALSRVSGLKCVRVGQTVTISRERQ